MRLKSATEQRWWREEFDKDEAPCRCEVVSALFRLTTNPISVCIYLPSDRLIEQRDSFISHSEHISAQRPLFKQFAYSMRRFQRRRPHSPVSISLVHISRFLSMSRSTATRLCTTFSASGWLFQWASNVCRMLDCCAEEHLSSIISLESIRV